MFFEEQPEVKKLRAEVEALQMQVSQTEEWKRLVRSYETENGIKNCRAIRAEAEVEALRAENEMLLGKADDYWKAKLAAESLLAEAVGAARMAVVALEDEEKCEGLMESGRRALDALRAALAKITERVSK